MKRIAIYVRNDSQNPRETSISTQLKHCREYAESHGFEISDVYKDKGISGMTDKRPAFKRLIADGMEHDFEAVLYYQNGYFSGNLNDYLHYKDMLEQNGVILISAQDNSTSVFWNYLTRKVVSEMLSQDTHKEKSFNGGQSEND